LTDPHLGYTKEQIAKNLILLEEHFKNYQCPICINKHLLAIEGYAEEGIPMSQEDAPLFNEIASYCRDARQSKEIDANKAIRRLREFRETIQGKGHAHGVAPSIPNSPPCTGPECHVKEMHLAHG
jgi:hypothetical protein